MLDIRFIRDHAALVKQAAANKHVDIDIDELLRLDAQHRALQSQIDLLNQQRNTVAAQTSHGQPTDDIIAAGKKIKQELSQTEAELTRIQAAYKQLLWRVPNIPSEDTPVGPDSSGNTVLRKVGKPPVFSFTPKEHWQLGEDLDVLDNTRAAKVAGARFTYLKGPAALLEFALIQFAFSVLTNEKTLQGIIEAHKLSVPATPFVPIVPPVFIKPDVFHKMARLEPADDRYYIPSDDLYLIGSAEHTLGAMHAEETLAEAELPKRYVGFSTSFRREAGSYGKDTRGILRLHQFDKLEIESLTVAEQAQAEQDFIVAIQEHLMQALELPYQVVQICTGDMGLPDVRQIDIETWLPGQDTYRETHTSDLMGDYQARRLKTKVKRADRIEFVHMNDATVFAMGRTIIAILENYQREDGTIGIPEVLQPYLGFNQITPAA